MLKRGCIGTNATKSKTGLHNRTNGSNWKALNVDTRVNMQATKHPLQTYSFVRLDQEHVNHNKHPTTSDLYSISSLTVHQSFYIVKNCSEFEHLYPHAGRHACKGSTHHLAKFHHAWMQLERTSWITLPCSASNALHMACKHKHSCYAYMAKPHDTNTDAPIFGTNSRVSRNASIFHFTP